MAWDACLLIMRFAFSSIITSLHNGTYQQPAEIIRILGDTFYLERNLEDTSNLLFYHKCDMIWSMEAKVGKCEIHKKIDITNMHNFVTE